MNNLKQYAVVNSATHIIENVVLWDGRTEPLPITQPEVVIDDEGNEVDTGKQIVVGYQPPWQPPGGTYVVCIEGTEAGIGWKVEDGEFIDVRSIGQNNSEQ